MTAERAGQGEVGAPGGCKQHGRVWAPRYRKVLVGTGRAISIVFGKNGARK